MSDNDTPAHDAGAALPQDIVPDAGRIQSPPSPLQVFYAITFLIVVTILAFLGAGFVGELPFAPSELTFWMIEMVFALLCGGAGALIGGSAVVRSTLKIPGNPINATLGGAVGMIVVGFAVAYLARPQGEKVTYELQIHNIPPEVRVDGQDYQIYVGASKDSAALTFQRQGNTVSFRVPVEEGQYRARIAVFRAEKDLSTTFGRCDLVFNTAGGPNLKQVKLVPYTSAGGHYYHAEFDDNYTQSVVREALKTRTATEKRPCLFGSLKEADRGRSARLGSQFDITRNEMWSKLSHFSKIPYSVAVVDVSNIDPQDTLPDLPPQRTPAIGSSAGLDTANVTSDANRSKSPVGPGPLPPSKPTEDLSTPPKVAPSTIAEHSDAQLCGMVDEYVKGEEFRSNSLVLRLAPGTRLRRART